MYVESLSACDNFMPKRQQFVFNAFIYLNQSGVKIGREMRRFSIIGTITIARLREF